MGDFERITELRNKLHRLNHSYYVENTSQVSDMEFDLLMQELVALEERHPEWADPNSPSVRVGSDISQDFQQVAHQYPMLSLGNTYNKEEVAAFYERVATGLNGAPFEICCELKFDGLSIALIYEDGHLTRAVTRGDGIRGDDVTANVRTIRSIPLQLPVGGNWPKRFEIRGEVLMPWTCFNSLNQEREANGEPLFANPRNAASGTLKSKNSAVVARRGLDAYLYYLLGDDLPGQSHYENLQAVAKWGFKVSKAMKLAHSLDEIYAFIDTWDEARHDLPVATDGVVLKVDNLTQQQLLGYTAKSPRWAIAYKFQPERARTHLLSVTFQVGRTGAITPVANMEPIHLAGTVVKRASLHNEDIIRQLDLHIGDVVFVEKAGEIIPQIVGVDTQARDITLGPPVKFAQQCPICGAKLIRYEGEAAHYCPNDTACPPQLKGKIEHFISREAMNIESLGPETVDDYFERGLIHNVADLYDLRVEDLCGADRSREKSARKIISGIKKSCSIPFERVLYALGIRFVGRTVAATLAHHFGSMQALCEAKLDDLLAVNGIGTAIAQSVISFLAEPRNVEIIDRLANAGVQMQAEQETHLSNVLEGQSIVISGTFIHHSRDEYKKLIAAHGGKNVSSLSKKTSFILAGEDMGPSKLEKANQLGIPLVNENDFLQSIGEIPAP